MKPEEVPYLTIPYPYDGTISSVEKAAELGVSLRTFRTMTADGRVTPAGRVPGQGSRGELRWWPDDAE